MLLLQLLLLLLLLLIFLLILRLLGVAVQDWVGDGVVLAEVLGEDVVQVDIVVGVLEFFFFKGERQAAESCEEAGCEESRISMAIAAQ